MGVVSPIKIKDYGNQSGSGGGGIIYSFTQYSGTYYAPEIGPGPTNVIVNQIDKGSLHSNRGRPTLNK